MRHQLELFCGADNYNPFPCGNNSSFCTIDTSVCDGIANCPNGDDEDIELCMNNEVFSEMATIKCDKKNIYNVTIKIKAVPCDGIYECENDMDEKNCSLPEYVLIVILVPITICLGIFGYLLWKKNSFTSTKKDQMPTLPDFDLLHGKESLAQTMFHAQSLDNFEQINTAFVDGEMKIHNGVLSELVCCIKVSNTILFQCWIKIVFFSLLSQNSLDSQTVAKVMSYIPEKKESFFGKVSSKLNDTPIIQK